MTVKEHYEQHLGNFYSWFSGSFEKNSEAFKAFCIDNKIMPASTKTAIDLGAGNGAQSYALAGLGFQVKAIDFNKQLLAEMGTRNNSNLIEIINDDIRSVGKFSSFHPELIICCGDTLPHLDSFSEVRALIRDAADILVTKGKIILTFRDYSTELQDTNRFIPVKSDSGRILTCFLEYFPDKVRVTDLLHEMENGTWVQKVSSYYKTRITNNLVVNCLIDSGFDVILDKTENRIISLIGQKNR